MRVPGVKHTTGIPAAAMMPTGQPVDTARPIAIAEQNQSRSPKHVFIGLRTPSADGEWPSSKLGRNSGYRSCGDDGRRQPRWFRGPRHSARMATLRAGDLSYPWEVGL